MKTQCTCEPGSHASNDGRLWQTVGANMFQQQDTSFSLRFLYSLKVKLRLFEHIKKVSSQRYRYYKKVWIRFWIRTGENSQTAGDCAVLTSCWPHVAGNVVLNAQFRIHNMDNMDSIYPVSEYIMKTGHTLARAPWVEKKRWDTHLSISISISIINCNKTYFATMQCFLQFIL